MIQPTCSQSIPRTPLAPMSLVRPRPSRPGVMLRRPRLHALLPLESRLVRLPTFLSIPLRCLSDGLFTFTTINPSTDNDDIAPTPKHDLMGGTILLTEFITFTLKSNTGREDQPIVCGISIDSGHGDETNDEIRPILLGHGHRLSSIFSRCEIILRRHFSEEQEGPSLWLTDFL